MTTNLSDYQYGYNDSNLDPHSALLLNEGGHIKFFSVKTLTQLVQSQGYQNIQYTFAGRLPYLWKSMLCSATPIS